MAKTWRVGVVGLGHWYSAFGLARALPEYDKADLVAVAQEKIKSWDPQPYATLVLDDVLLDPVLNPMEYKRDLVGALAFDRQNGILYLIERLADDYRSVIHVWEISY